MADENLRRMIAQGIAAANQENTLMALVHLENAAREEASPLLNSYLGYCLAKERHQLARGLALCQQAIQDEPQKTDHYLNLGRIYLLAGQKNQAISTLRRGLKVGRNPRIVQELKKLGLRKSPVFSGLERNHPANKYAGILLQRLGFR